MATGKRRQRQRPSARGRLAGEAAREQILEIAARRVREVGPDGLRLQEIAREVGVSHPAILHHFGSRQELVRAVVDRSLIAVEQDVIETLQAASDPDELDPSAMLSRIRVLMEDRGHARLIAWLVLAGYEHPARGSKLGDVARAVHSMRSVHFSSRQESPPDFEDTLFVVFLASVALFGDALCGATLRESAGLGADADAKGRFHEWLARLLVDYLDRPPRAATLPTP
jgi:AcrR family transcriptional regulator